MCGFVGEFRVNGGAEVSTDALTSIQHRGPDASGVWKDNHLHLRHCRLKIQDLSDEANQPMVSDDGRYVLAFNGELYDINPLQADLETDGQTFHTTSDTEFLLHWLIKRGVQALTRLRGCYALAFYDQVTGELCLARDPMGIKPLYYRRLEGGGVQFASEYRAIASPTDVWNPTAMADFLETGFNRKVSLVADVLSLDPRFPAVFRSDGKSSARKFEAPPLQEASDVLTQLRQAVHVRLVSDVPLGCFLSGGLDSSAIAALAFEQKKDLKTFSLGFTGGGLLDERDDARRAAEFIGTDHHELELSNDDLIASLDDWISCLDLPFGDSSALAVYHLSRFARKHVTVALSGDGADELFAGYNRHRAFLKAGEESRLWTMLAQSGLVRRVARGLGENRGSALGLKAYRLNRFLRLQRLPIGQRYAFLTRFVQPEMRSEVFRHSGSDYDEGINSLQLYLSMDQKLVLEGDMLVKADRMSMAHGLEIRVPFLDQHVVRTAQGLPESALIHDGVGKYILRDAVKGMLPESTLCKPKHGFEIPMQQWLSGPLSENLSEFVRGDRFDESKGWNPAGIDKLLKDFQSKPNPELTHLMWNLWVLKRWEAVNQSSRK